MKTFPIDTSVFAKLGKEGVGDTMLAEATALLILTDSENGPFNQVCLTKTQEVVTVKCTEMHLPDKTVWVDPPHLHGGLGG
mgnify:CR=1 FL=1